MARPWRVEFAGACYHVINRGNYRRNLFSGKGAAAAFERTLGEAAERFGWVVYAYVIMSNHFHLAVELTEPNLSRGMQWLQGTWIRRYNCFRRLIGRPFQGRYKALLVEPGEALRRVCDYIHLNPVRAGIVRPSEPEKYPWSSLARFPDQRRPKWLNPSVVLSVAGGLPDRSAGWAEYREYLEFLAGDGPSREMLAADKLSRGWCIGGNEFKAEMRREHLSRGADLERFAGLEPETVQVERERFWEEQLLRLAQIAKIKLGDLPAKKSHRDKVRLAAGLKQATSVSNAWLAERLAMGRPASASQFVRRYLLTTKGRAETKALLSIVKT